MPQVQGVETTEPAHGRLSPSHGGAGVGQDIGEGKAGLIARGRGHHGAVIRPTLGQAPDGFVRRPIGRTEQGADRVQKTSRGQRRGHAEAAFHKVEGEPQFVSRRNSPA